MAVPNMHWLTLKYRDSALEQAFQKLWSQRLVRFNLVASLITIGACTAWAAAHSADWISALASRDSSGSDKQLQDMPQVCSAGDAAADVAGACSVRDDPELLQWRSAATMALFAAVAASLLSSLVACWLILFQRHWFLANNTAVISVEWWLARWLSICGGLVYCKLGMSNLGCKAVTWVGIYLNVSTSVRLPFRNSLAYHLLYSLLRWMLWSKLSVSELFHDSNRQYLSQMVLILGLQHIVESTVRLYYARMTSQPSTAGQTSTALQQTPEAEQDCQQAAAAVLRRQASAQHPEQVAPLQQRSRPPSRESRPQPSAHHVHPHMTSQHAASAAATAAAAAAAASAAAAALSSNPAAAAAGGSPTVVVAALPAVRNWGGDGPWTQHPGASLVYESPLLHRSIGVKVYSNSGVSNEMMVSRIASSVQAALDGLPQGARVIDYTGYVGQPGQPAHQDPAAAGPSSSSAAAAAALPPDQPLEQAAALLVNRVLVPGCALMLGTVVTQRQLGTAGRQQLPAQEQQPTQDTEVAAYFCDGVWRLQLSSVCGCNSSNGDRNLPATVPLQYSTLETLESAAADGSFTAALAAWLDSSTDLPNNQLVTCPALEQYVVGSFGCELQILLTSTAATAAEAPAGDSCTCTAADLPVRLVVMRDNNTVLDQQQKLPQAPQDVKKPAGLSNSSRAWNLHQKIPVGEALRDGLLDHLVVGCTLTLHVLSDEQQVSGSSSATQGSNPASGIRHSRHLASITAVVLPTAAATELLTWIQMHSLTHSYLQPILRDMAVVLQATSIGGPIRTAAAAAVLRGKLDGAATAADTKALASAVAATAGDAVHALQLPLTYWAVAATAAERLRQTLAAFDLPCCSSVMQGCLEQVSQVADICRVASAQVSAAAKA